MGYWDEVLAVPVQSIEGGPMMPPEFWQHVQADAPSFVFSAEAFELQKQQIREDLILVEALRGDALVPMLGKRKGRAAETVWPMWLVIGDGKTTNSEKWIRDLDPRDVLEEPVTVFGTRSPEVRTGYAMTPPEIWPELRMVRIGPWFQGQWRAFFFKVPAGVDMAQWLPAQQAPMSLYRQEYIE